MARMLERETRQEFIEEPGWNKKGDVWVHAINKDVVPGDHPLISFLFLSYCSIFHL